MRSNILEIGKLPTHFANRSTVNTYYSISCRRAIQGAKLLLEKISSRWYNLFRLKRRKKGKRRIRSSLKTGGRGIGEIQSVLGAIGSRFGTNFEGRIERVVERLMRKGQGRWHVLYGKTGKPRHLDANVEKGGRSGILCPVTPPGAPRLCPILSS